MPENKPYLELLARLSPLAIAAVAEDLLYVSPDALASMYSSRGRGDGMKWDGVPFLYLTRTPGVWGWNWTLDGVGIVGMSLLCTEAPASFYL